MCLIYCDYLIQHIVYKNTISLETKIYCKLESDPSLRSLKYVSKICNYAKKLIYGHRLVCLVSQPVNYETVWTRVCTRHLPSSLWPQSCIQVFWHSFAKWQPHCLFFRLVVTAVVISFGLSMHLFMHKDMHSFTCWTTCPSIIDSLTHPWSYPSVCSPPICSTIHPSAHPSIHP